MTLYAAYGSNLDPQQMLKRVPHSPHRGNGWLEGWRITFGGEEIGWEGAVATIVEDPTSHVFVAIYDLTKDDENLSINGKASTPTFIEKSDCASKLLKVVH